MAGEKVNFVKIYLKPAELCVSKAPALVTTILGSCIAVTMCQRDFGLAAICHVPQPCCPKRSMDCPKHCTRKYHYVACVIPEMLHHLEMAGAERGGLEVKLFGGAAVLKTTTDRSIGRQNIDCAMSILKENGLKLKVRQVGGTSGRKIIFNTYTGEVMLKYIRYSEGWKSMEME